MMLFVQTGSVLVILELEFWICFEFIPVRKASREIRISDLTRHTVNYLLQVANQSRDLRSRTLCNGLYKFRHLSQYRLAGLKMRNVAAIGQQFGRHRP